MASEGDSNNVTVSTPSGHADGPEAAVDGVIQPRLNFPVVGIGASAGGIEALRRFFGAAATDAGMAYIVIQHLSPEHPSLMVEIIGRCTAMPVRQVEEGLCVEPNHVYVIRPGNTVTLEDGALHLGEPVERRGHRRPVDDFFRSLAREQRELAIAVVLSGTGTNGTAGAQAIKAVGGLCIAQDPETADFPGMPRSLIYAGYADQVLKTEDIPSVLRRYVAQPYVELDNAGHARAVAELERHRQTLSEILALVRQRTQHDFAPYKTGTVLRRIQRRMGLLGVNELEGYSARLREDAAEVRALANDLMINVTGFFRDPQVWEALREAVVRPLVEARAANTPIRAWVTACASGEEPYSLAMLIAEEAARAGKTIEVKIFATDTADKSLALARAGIYPGGIEGDLSPERLERFFDKEEHTYRIKKSLREQVVFAPQDLLRDPPFSQLDIVTCRNLLIYLEPEAQRRALSLLRFALREGGYLLLGNSETLGDAGTLFEVVSKRFRIYRRVGSAAEQVPELPLCAPQISVVQRASAASTAVPARPSGAPLIQAALLEAFGPPTAVVDANERILYVHGDTAPYLQPVGEISQNLLENVRTSLRGTVRSALRRAVSEQRAVTMHVEGPQTGAAGVAIVAAPLRESAGIQQFRVSFISSGGTSGNDVPQEAGSAATGRLQAGPGDMLLEEELRQVRRELQSSLEAFEAANEELQAANEETTSINEELQSSNEELETSKEELQSINEELTTVNTQLQAKVLELNELTNDLDNLLSSTNIAVVFLDRELNVRRFTPAITDLLELRAVDIGRPLAHLATKFTDGDLIRDASQVIANLSPLESEVRSHSGRWYLRRTLPFLTQEHRIAGVVITFIEISARKQAAEAIETDRARLQAVIEQMPAAVLLIEVPSAKLLFANRQAATLFNQSYPLPVVGYSWSAIYSGFQGRRVGGRPYEAADWPLARVLASDETVLDEDLEFTRPDDTRAVVSMSAAPIKNSAGTTIAAVATLWDITERKAIDAQLLESLQSAQQLRVTAERANRAKDDFISNVSHELRTPLNTIRLWARMFLDGKVRGDDLMKGAAMIDRAALAQQQLIDDLLDVSRMASGRLRLALRDADLGAAVAGAVAAVQPLAESRDIVLTGELSPEIGMVSIDPDRIQQIVWNLLANAVKFTPSGGRITVRAWRQDGTVCIEVIDTGIGIRPELLPHIFDRFRQGEGGATRRYGGLGLGLAIAKQLAELHQGTLTARSEGHGRGATFTVHLPLERHHNAAPPMAPKRRLQSDSLRGLEVLLVEDEEMARETTAHLLEQHGAAVSSASSAALACEAFERRRPDVIVADIGMPETDGYTLLTQLRRIEHEVNTQRVPAVAVTAFARSEDRERALAAGFDEHLTKPLDAQRLIALLAHWGYNGSL